MLTLREAAAQLGINRMTLYVQYRKGRLQAENHGTIVLVHEDEVSRYAREVQGKTGFASPTHPLHGTQAGGGKRKPQKDNKAA